MLQFFYLLLLAAAPAAELRAAAVPSGAPQPIRLRPIVICDDFPAGYQVTVADMNADGRPDIIALGEQPGTVDLFENPGRPDAKWPRRPISGSATRRNIDLAIHDINGDGKPDLAVASDFDLGRSDTGGTLSWFAHAASDRPWSMHAIGAEPTAHRVRWADIDGDDRPELIVVPIVGRGASAPSYQQAPARLLCFRVPGRPADEPWPAHVIDNMLTLVHGACVIDWDHDGRDELLTASTQGIHLHKAEGAGPDLKWTRRPIAAGRLGTPPASGSSEVAVGRRRSAWFVAAIEPWHGSELAVYAPPVGGTASPSPWHREVIDNTLNTGHALCCADLDGDGCDEIIAGYRGEGTSLNGYRRGPGPAGRWERFLIDAGGIAAQGCVAADINADGRLDLVATGGVTHNVKLYLNETAR